MKGTDTKGALVQISKGDRVSFAHPDTGALIEGVVNGRTRAGGIKVAQMTGFKRGGEIPPEKPGLPAGRSYLMEETIWTVPKTVEVKILVKRG